MEGKTRSAHIRYIKTFDAISKLMDIFIVGFSLRSGWVGEVDFCSWRRFDEGNEGDSPPGAVESDSAVGVGFVERLRPGLGGVDGLYWR